MRCFQFRIIRDGRQVLINWINAQDREDAMQKLEQTKKELDADTIRLTEVFGAHWRC
ncbi:MAG: hypothetical protein IJ342_00640 [Muribaculaceae bacterium]|nr:hypothetical protein [Muribaculaceae bacterium]